MKPVGGSFVCVYSVCVKKHKWAGWWCRVAVQCTDYVNVVCVVLVVVAVATKGAAVAIK